MTINRYKEVAPLEVSGDIGPEVVGTYGLKDGLMRHLSPIEIPLGATSYMRNVRFERSGIRKDFGDRALGSVAIGRVLCVIEHKFIDANGVQWSSLYRLIRNTDGRAKTEVYNKTTEEWEDDSITTSAQVQDVLVRGISVRGVLLFACHGGGILEREEVVSYSAEFDDFPSGNSLTASGEYTQVQVEPTDVVEGNEFTIYFDVDLTLTTGTDLEVDVSLYIDDELIETKEYVQAAPGSTNWPGETFVVVKEIESGDYFKLQIDRIEVNSSNTPRSTTLTSIGGTPEYQGTKSEAPEAYNKEYTWTYDLVVDDLGEEYDPEDKITIGYYYDNGTGWSKVYEEDFPVGTNETVERTYFLGGMDSGDKFGLHVEDWGPFSPSGFNVQISNIEVGWEESTGSYSVDVHGHNLPTDADPNHGVEFNAKSGSTITLEPVTGAPDASWIESFGDRIIALRDGSDSQQFSASSDGTHDDWTGGDSVEDVLVDTRNDPIDDLQCAGPLSSNVLAVIRSRSIMKAQETGNVLLAVGVTHWLEGIGTQSPHSIAVTPVGLMFLGHDFMAYILDESGLTPVGLAIQQEIIEKLSSNAHLVDGVYEPMFKEYWLGIPEDGASHMTAIYIFDVGEFQASGGQKARWRRKVQSMERFAIITNEV